MSGTKKRITILIALFFFLLFLTIGVVIFLKPSPGRTNFLIMGISGEGHAGEDLTDSMMFVSVENRSGKTLIVSLPRDIWITSLRTKLNGVYHYKGMEETKKTVAEILGQKIDYGLVLDFNFFKNIIDQVGGIEIEVERAFDDYKYPIAGKENDLCNGDKEFKCRYEHLHFDAGFQVMDSERALKFVRSRNAKGDEGTDFARDKRQQKVILALKNRILSPGFIFSPGKPWQLLKTILANIKTDIPQNKYLDLVKIGLRIRTKNIKTVVLGEEYLINPKPAKIYDYQWVLVPKTGDWEEVKKAIDKL